MRAEKAIPMKKHQHQMRYAQVLVVCFGFGIVGIAACSSTESVQGGKRVEYGQWAPVVDAGDAGVTIDATDGGNGDASDGAGTVIVAGPIHPPGWRPPSPAEIVEKEWGIPLTLEERDIVNTCSRRPWSKNVPDRDCTKDKECGDGICDRGHCSAIYTCTHYPGGPCKKDEHCHGLCMEGRCRSCVSDEECQKKDKNPYGVCDAPGSHPPGRSCATRGVVPPAEEVKAMCDAAPADKKPAYCQ